MMPLFSLLFLWVPVVWWWLLLSFHVQARLLFSGRQAGRTAGLYPLLLTGRQGWFWSGQGQCFRDCCCFWLAGRQDWSGLAGKAQARLAFPRLLLLLAGWQARLVWSGRQGSGKAGVSETAAASSGWLLFSWSGRQGWSGKRLVRIPSWGGSDVLWSDRPPFIGLLLLLLLLHRRPNPPIYAVPRK